MAESFADFFVSLFKDKIPSELIIFLISICPILELRGGLIAASLLNIDFITAFIICYFGNIIPVPFILLFIRKIFQFLRNKKGFSKVIEKLEIRSMRQSDKVKKASGWGLLAIVAIPLPGTGGWTGSLIAALLDMRIRRSFPIIAIGILFAGIIMSIPTYIIPSFFQ
ncbi:MAG TPA: small multi-drug export protein [Clostridia bacterium]|nr:small multi-drug export protein [Clostridia bacterium]